MPTVMPPEKRRQRHTKETVLAKNSTERKVTNIAFVDMNTHALGWLASISKEGTVMGQKLTSDMRLVDYYYQDGTHPNALGSQGLVEGMFLNSQKQIREYPALRGLLETYEGNIPADNSTASGRRASKVPQRIMVSHGLTEMDTRRMFHNTNIRQL